jgi:hypothetical protein
VRGLPQLAGAAGVRPCVARFAPPVQRCTRCALALPADLSGGLRRARCAAPAAASRRRWTACLRRRELRLSLVRRWSAGYKFGEQHGWAGIFAGLLLQSPGRAQALAS